MKRALMLLAITSNLALSSSLPGTLERELDVARVIAVARHQVLVLAPDLRSRTVATSLRKAVVESGVSIFILCDADLIRERSSFVPILSLLRERKHQVEVRVLRNVTRRTLIVDETQTVFGALIAEPNSIGSQPTRLLIGKLEARNQARAFWTQWKRATPWTYQIQSPKFSNGGQK